MENNEIQVISTTDALGAVTSAEIDKQIATAHQFPRNVSSCLQSINAIALMDEEIAEDCYYHLERKDRDGNTSIIEGPSIRLAEIVASCWGNLRIASRVIGNDGKMVTVEGVCHDLESNVAVSQQQVRSIVTKYGQTYSNDMQVMTINAASAVAVRNAINKVIPKAITNKVVEQCKSLVRGKASELPEKRQKIVATFASLGVTREQLCEKLGIDSIDQITLEMVGNLRGLYTALKDGATTIDDEFPQPKVESEAANKARKVVENARRRVSKTSNEEQRQQELDEAAKAFFGEEGGAE